MSVLKLYHGTSADRVDSIKAKGLLPKLGGGADDWARAQGEAMPERAHKCNGDVCLAMMQRYAAKFARLVARTRGSSPVVIELEIPLAEFENLKMAPDFDSPPFMAVRTPDVVPPKWIKSVEPISEAGGDRLTCGHAAATFV